MALEGIDIEPRDYQQRIIERVVGMLTGPFRDERGHDQPEAGSVLIESPTGSGKTLMALAIAARMQRERGCRVAWVAMRRNLLAQAAHENVSRGFDVEIEFLSMFQKSVPRAELLVVDEAQHDATASCAAIHAGVRPDKVLGLSATPWRADRASLLFERAIRDAGIHRLIQDGYLAPFRHFTLANYRPATVAATIVEDPSRWGRSLVFFRTQAECDECHELLRQGGVACETVNGSSDRERQLADFETGRLSVLLSMSVLAEGFDDPGLQTVFVRPSRSRGCTVQMAGRVLRCHADHPIKQVVQCRHTHQPFTRTATAAEQYVATPDGWRSLTPNADLDRICQNALRSIAKTTVELPGLLKRQRRLRNPWGQNRLDSTALAAR